MATGPYHEAVPRERERTAEIVAGGSIVEAIGGLCAVVLSILGLAKFSPMMMLTIGTMALGVALIAEGGSIAARFNRLMSVSGTQYDTTWGGGITAEFLGGVCGFILSLLALIGLAQMILIPVSLIALGAGILLGSGGVEEINRVVASNRFAGGGETPPTTTTRFESSDYGRVAAVSAASGTQIFVGLGAITLGILALIGFNPLILCLVGVLAVGCSVLFTGGTIASRMWRIFSR